MPREFPAELGEFPDERRWMGEDQARAELGRMENPRWALGWEREQ